MIGGAIELVGVEKRFGTRRCLAGLDLHVPEGMVFGFLGPNGAGKTTTLRVLLGLVRPDGGTARVLGLDPTTDGEQVRRRVGVLLDTDGLYARLSAHDNLLYFARIFRIASEERERRTRDLLQSFGLYERRFDIVATWSKGMRQKLAVVRAMLHRPRVLLLDEPFAGMDPVAAVDLRTRLVELAESEAVTILLTSHDLGHVEKCCQRVAVIDGGRIVAEGAPGAMGRTVSSVRVSVRGEGLSDGVLVDMQRQGWFTEFQRDGDSARLTCAKDKTKYIGTELVQRGVLLTELSAHQDSLEEVFLSLIRPGGDRS